MYLSAEIATTLYKIPQEEIEPLIENLKNMRKVLEYHKANLECKLRDARDPTPKSICRKDLRICQENLCRAQEEMFYLGNLEESEDLEASIRDHIIKKNSLYEYLRETQEALKKVDKNDIKLRENNREFIKTLRTDIAYQENIIMFLKKVKEYRKQEAQHNGI